jgi:Flp pilus assembly protein TadB
MAEAASPGLLARSLGSGLGVGILVVSVGLQATGIIIIRRIAAVPA